MRVGLHGRPDAALERATTESRLRYRHGLIVQLQVGCRVIVKDQISKMPLEAFAAPVGLWRHTGVCVRRPGAFCPAEGKWGIALLGQAVGVAVVGSRGMRVIL